MIGLLDILDPNTLISQGGLILVALIVFAESGLLLGFMLPGDSLLFVAGFLASDAGGGLLPSIWVTAPVVVVAAFAGDQVGYAFGSRVGPRLAARRKSWWFDPRHVERASAFFERHGPKTIVLARFVPIVRTFAPIVAGVGAMRYRTFVTYNLVGAVVWGAGLTTLGWAVGGVGVVRHNIEVAIIGIVVVSLLPPFVEAMRHRRHRSASEPESPPMVELSDAS